MVKKSNLYLKAVGWKKYQKIVLKINVEFTKSFEII